jgi:hypothetical protein
MYNSRKNKNELKVENKEKFIDSTINTNIFIESDLKETFKRLGFENISTPKKLIATFVTL